jgi:UDP:flavonoid glycosyltransferase YjiC (YdhE family)
MCQLSAQNRKFDGPIQTGYTLHVEETGGFLIVGLDYGGTWKPMLGLARMLVERGHAVAVLGASAMRRGVEAAGGSFVPLSGVFDDPPGYVLENDWDSYDAKITGPEFAAELAEAVERTGARVLVIDCCFLNVLSEADRLGLPTAAVMHFIALEMLDEHPADWDELLKMVNVTRVSRGMAPLALGTGMYDLWNSADLTLHLPPPSWLRAELPANARRVGPIANEPPSDDGWDLPWSKDDETPLIMISMSSTYLRHERVLERLAEAAAGLDAHTLLSLAGSIPRDALSLPDQVVVRDWVNFPTLLPHVDLLVTHAGQATVSAGLLHSVPLLVHPLTRDRDQFQVARHVVDDGSGLEVGERTSVEEIRKGMLRLLEEESFQTAAKRIAEELDALGGGRVAIEELEALRLRP